jgi:allantoinase
MTEAILRGRRVITPEGSRPAAIHVSHGRIIAVEEYEHTGAGIPVTDAGDAVILPGLVDTHVHINEPGRTDWEGFASATRAAAAGGVTTLLDMPLNSVPATTTAAALETKRAAARGRVAVDVGFIGGVVPGNAAELPALHAAGVRAFKCFLVPSGVEEFPLVTESELRTALPILARLGALLMVHAELPEPLARAASSLGGNPRSYAAWLGSRPPTAEVEAVRLVGALSAEYGVRIHIVHLSSADSLPVLAAARSGGARVTAETCPHYLTFAAEEIPDGATEFKCAPAIGPRANRERLWESLAAGSLLAVVSDHSPCPPALKSRDTGSFVSAWGGIASLQVGIAAVWSGARGRGYSLEHLVEWMSAGPASLAGLSATKGAIAAGRDADLVLFHPDDEFTVDAARLRHRHAVTPYHGRRLAGVVEATYLRGVEVFRRGVPDKPPSGRLMESLPG